MSKYNINTKHLKFKRWKTFLPARNRNPVEGCCSGEFFLLVRKPGKLIQNSFKCFLDLRNRNAVDGFYSDGYVRKPGFRWCLALVTKGNFVKFVS